MGGQTTAIMVAASNPGKVSGVVTSKSHLNEATRSFTNRLGEISLVQAGSALKFCRVAEGEADIYTRLAPQKSHP
jgi:3'(2'), 5'-bisphosphate nucleotidase